MDINFGLSSSTPEYLTFIEDTSSQPLLLFSANDNDHGNELYCTDGNTNTRLVKDIMVLYSIV